MEKPKPKTKLEKRPVVQPPPLAESLPGDPHAVGLPTIEELATIAATLARKFNNTHTREGNRADCSISGLG